MISAAYVSNEWRVDIAMEKKIFGYIRVSTREQKVSRQIDELKKYVPNEDDLFIDHASGKDFDREAYNQLKKMVRDEDELYVKSLDRFGRNKQLIKEELEWFRKKNVIVRILDIPTTLMSLGEGNKDVQEMVNNILIEVLATIAQRERETTLERQKEGIAAAKRRGQRFGRTAFNLPPNWNTVKHHYLRGHLRAREAIRLLGMKRSTFYKFIRMSEEEIQIIRQKNELLRKEEEAKSTHKDEPTTEK